MVSGAQGCGRPTRVLCTFSLVMHPQPFVVFFSVLCSVLWEK